MSKLVSIVLDLDNLHRALTAMAAYSGQQAGDGNYDAANRTIDTYNAIVRQIRGTNRLQHFVKPAAVEAKS
jgi:hypothetical protein